MPNIQSMSPTVQRCEFYFSNKSHRLTDRHDKNKMPPNSIQGVIKHFKQRLRAIRSFDSCLCDPAWNTCSVQSAHTCLFVFAAESKRTRAPRGTDRSPEYNERFCYKLDSRVKNLTTEWNQTQHFITHASRSLLWIRFVAVAFRSEDEVF